MRFHAWLSGKQTRGDYATSTRSFTSQSQWCWNAAPTWYRLGRSTTRSCSMAPISMAGAQSTRTPAPASSAGDALIGPSSRPGPRSSQAFHQPSEDRTTRSKTASATTAARRSNTPDVESTGCSTNIPSTRKNHRHSSPRKRGNPAGDRRLAGIQPSAQLNRTQQWQKS